MTSIPCSHPNTEKKSEKSPSINLRIQILNTPLSISTLSKTPQQPSKPSIIPKSNLALNTLIAHKVVGAVSPQEDPITKEATNHERAAILTVDSDEVVGVDEEAVSVAADLLGLIHVEHHHLVLPAVDLVEVVVGIPMSPGIDRSGRIDRTVRRLRGRMRRRRPCHPLMMNILLILPRRQQRLLRQPRVRLLLANLNNLPLDSNAMQPNVTVCMPTSILRVLFHQISHSNLLYSSLYISAGKIE